MAHELVSRINKSTQAREFLFAYAGEKGWHGLGRKIEDFAEAIRYCELDREVTIQDMTAVSPWGETVKIPDRRAVFDSSGRYLGTVGPDYEVHQDSDLAKLAETYLSTGLVEFDTCGMLLGGSRVWISLKVKEDAVEIVPGDTIKTNLFLGQGHDMTLSVVQGSTDIRTVCNNTMTMVLREEGHERIKHRSGVVLKSAQAAERIMAELGNRAKRIEAYRFLARTAIPAGGVDKFLGEVLGESVAKSTRKGGPNDRIREKFIKGIGTNGRTWWDLLNAVTEDVTHTLGNNMKSDGVGDREGRAINGMFFGAGAKLSAKAFVTAVRLAGGTEASKLLLPAAA